MVVELRAASIARTTVLGPLLHIGEADAAVQIKRCAMACRVRIEGKVVLLVEALLDDEGIGRDGDRHEVGVHGSRDSGAKEAQEDESDGREHDEDVTRVMQDVLNEGWIHENDGRQDCVKTIDPD